VKIGEVRDLQPIVRRVEPRRFEFVMEDAEASLPFGSGGVCGQPLMGGGFRCADNIVPILAG